MKSHSATCLFFFTAALLCFAPAGALGVPGPRRSIPAPVRNRKPLAPNALDPLPLTSVQPRGWLRRQLQIQADGLTGHLDELWPDVGSQSGWLGGAGESWERGPYYLDGLLPLAYLLDDRMLIAKAEQRINWVLTHQGRDGWIGPERNKDWWPNMVMLKALTQYQEATGDPRVIPAMQRYFRAQLAQLSSRPLRDWGKFRWADEELSVLWLYNRTGEADLLDLARALERQGYDWKAEFASFPFTTKSTKDSLRMKPGVENNDFAMGAHGVNNAMALKTSAVWARVTGDEADRRAAAGQLATLEEYHLLPNGMFSCDEHLAGRDPSQGTELCSVVEEQFSLEQLISVLGESGYADRLERITYNALPATLSKDMWAHQYDQQANQVLCDLRSRNWTTNGPESNIFGLEPNFGCCTANFHQGWPKFAASLWMATPDEGLAAIAYGPSQVETVVRNGTRVEIEEDTDYPFRGEIRMTVDPFAPASFPLKFRIPAWAKEAGLEVNGHALEPAPRAGEFYAIEREWRKGDHVVLRFPLTVRTSQWYHNSVAVERGPLVFAMRIGEKWTKIEKGMSRPAKSPAADWEVAPTTPWNYGLIIDTPHPEHSVRVREKPVGDYPFSPEGAPVELAVEGRRIPEWKLADGSAGPLPASPVASREPVETLTLIPYGSAKLRITAFPRVAP